MDKAIDVKLEEKGYAAMLWSVANVFPIMLPQIWYPWSFFVGGLIAGLNLYGFWRFYPYRYLFLATAIINELLAYFMGHFTIVSALPRIPYFANAYWDMYWQFQLQANGL